MSSITARQVVEQEERVAHLLDDVIARLSLQPDDSTVHKAEVYGQGLRIPVTLIRPYVRTTEQVYVYALPWSRGWSVFVSPYPREGAYSWRDVPSRWSGLQRPVYCPRGMSGAEHVHTETLVNSILACVTRLEQLNKANINRARKRFWYWPTSAFSALALTTDGV